MSNANAVLLLKGLLQEISLADGGVATERFGSLREVDAKVREAKHIISSLQGLPRTFLEEMTNNVDFEAQSRRVRLQSLSGYIRSAIKFAESGALSDTTKIVHPAPDVSKIATQIPPLKRVIDQRWKEAQRCMHADCFTASIILMGSILEAFLLARAMLSAGAASQSPRAPKAKAGQALAIQDWSLSSLIDVAVDIGWIKTDRGKFSHALRESRNVVHPWVEVTTRANFDLATCRTSWEVLQASVDDLLASYP